MHQNKGKAAKVNANLVTLGVLQRITLLGVLPREGDILTMRIIRELREALSFSEDEHKALDLRTEPGPDGKGAILWRQLDADGKPLVCTKAIEIGPKARQVISNALTELSAAKKLHDEHVDLYDMFVKAQPVKKDEAPAA